MNKKGDYSYQWRLSVKHCFWNTEIRPSVFKCPFHKAHCTCVLFWKGFPTLILGSDIKISAETLLLGSETFEASSGSDKDYSFLRRWLWLFFFLFLRAAFYKKEFKIIRRSKASCFQPFSTNLDFLMWFSSSFTTPSIILIFLQQGFILKTVSK